MLHLKSTKTSVLGCQSPWTPTHITCSWLLCYLGCECTPQGRPPQAEWWPLLLGTEGRVHAPDGMASGKRQD